jgi:hypothetical protein
MSDDIPGEREPLFNLMKVVALGAGVVSQQTLTILLAVAEMDPRERTVDHWARLMLAIEAAENRAAAQSLIGPPIGFRRTVDPSLSTKPRRRSGVQPKVSPSSNPDRLKESG